MICGIEVMPIYHGCRRWYLSKRGILCYLSSLYFVRMFQNILGFSLPR